MVAADAAFAGGDEIEHRPGCGAGEFGTSLEDRLREILAGAKEFVVKAL